MQDARHTRTVHAVTDPAAATNLLRDRTWGVEDFASHLERLRAGTGEDVSLLTEMTRSSLVYQSGDSHLGTRRAIAGFLSPAGTVAWLPAIDRAIEAGLDRLAASAKPDLVHDFSNPVFLGWVGAMMGIAVDDDLRMLRSIEAVRALAEPLQPIRGLREARDALAYMTSRLEPVPASGAAQTVPVPMSSLLHAASLPTGVSASILTVSLVVAAHTAADSLALALAGLLAKPPSVWQAVAEPGWAEANLEDVIRNFPSTLKLVRVASHGSRIGGCPVAAGDVATIDVTAINASVDGGGTEPDTVSRAPRSLSFGEGLHKCPGAVLARLVLGRALPAIAARFPFLSIDADAMRIARTTMVQVPTALPCDGTGARRRAARLWEIGDHDLARVIATDAQRFSPPEMTGHLEALAARSGRDLSVAIRIARNAPFFLSGERQQAIRLLTLDVLGGNRLVPWIPLVDRTIAELLDAMAAARQADLVADLCDPLFRVVTCAVLGIHPPDAVRFDAAAPLLQDLLEPLLPLRTILRLQEVCAALLADVEAGEGTRFADRPAPLLARLHAAEPDGFDPADRRALVLVLYGASFNIAHTLANALLRIAVMRPEARRALADASDAAWLDFDVLPAAASPRFIYRIARADGAIGPFAFARGDTLQLHLGEINRGRGPGHLALGHGLHRCLGAALARLLMGRAIPAFLRRFPDFALTSEPVRFPMPQTIALASLPSVLFDPASMTKDHRP